MVATGFPDPAPIEFTSLGSVLPVAADYTAIFTHTNQANCPLTGCFLRSSTDCTAPLAA